MNEEEKEAIKYIKEFKNETKERVGNKSTMVKNLNILLKLINKKQKEIKVLEQINSNCEVIARKQQKEIEKLEKNRKVSQYFAKTVAEEYIHKDKIREKLEEVKNKREAEIKKYQVSMLGSAIDILLELLEEK